MSPCGKHFASSWTRAIGPWARHGGSPRSTCGCGSLCTILASPSMPPNILLPPETPLKHIAPKRTRPGTSSNCPQYSHAPTTRPSTHVQAHMSKHTYMSKHTRPGTHVQACTHSTPGVVKPPASVPSSAPFLHGQPRSTDRWQPYSYLAWVLLYVAADIYDEVKQV